MIALLLAALAFGQECSLDLPTVRSDTSMAWVSRTGDHARGGEYLWVTPTGELSAWIGRQDRATLGGLLRHLGLRRRKSEPKRHYKVVVFDATHASLCRPIEGEAPGAEISGVVTCETNLSRSNRQHGELVDALEARDAEWAETTMRAHLLSSRASYRRIGEDRRRAKGTANGAAPGVDTSAEDDADAR